MTKGFAKHNHISRKGGFSLTELLIVVGIIVILAAIAVIPLVKNSKNMTNTELDSKAQIIYHAAQNRTMELRAVGLAYTYSAENAFILPLTPSDLPSDMADAELYYVSSAATSTAGESILPAGSVDGAIYNNNWIVEYDPATGGIYSVFYSEDAPLPAYETLNSLRDKNARHGSDEKVGYFCGGGIDLGETKALTPTMMGINGEKLSATMLCAIPEGVTGDLQFTIYVTDADGTVATRVIPSGEITLDAGVYKYELVLDDLTTQESRFHSLFPELKAGTDINISFMAEIPGNNRVGAKRSAQWLTNSLFAYDGNSGENEATIIYARHLQNLDSASGVTGITSAVQKNDISFEDDINNERDWASVYAGRPLSPITNSELNRYCGSFLVDPKDEHSERLYTEIRNLMIAPTPTGNAGLFTSFAGGEIADIRIINPLVSAPAGSAGAIVGKAEGNLTITGARVYTDNAVTTMAEDISELMPWISGAQNVGALVGDATGVTVTVKDSFAAAVLTSNQIAGGLVGYGTLSTENSYADCYIMGATTGGLLGDGNLSMLNSYTAGYQRSTAASGGFTAGAITQSVNAYSATAFSECEGEMYATAFEGSNITNTYYVSDICAGENTVEDILPISLAEFSDPTTAVEMLGEAFAEADDTTTYTYNYLGQENEYYIFPRLTDFTHYGDWSTELVTEDSEDIIAYYEAYLDGSNTVYGYQIGDTNTLRDDLTLIGDGYALVLPKTAVKPTDTSVTIKLTNKASNPEIEITLQKASALSINMTVGEENVECFMFIIPGTYFSNAPEVQYYRKLAVTIEGEEKVAWFNPHFAKTVSKTAGAATKPRTVIIRTPRQFYNLSLYHDLYMGFFGRSKFSQELDIDYTTYDWDNAIWGDINVYGSTVTEQKPIGNNTVTFASEYDGGDHSITGVSISSPTPYVGLFGINEGTIKNLFFLSDYVGGYYERGINFTGRLSGYASRLYLGTFVGENRGTIENCATAGFDLGAAASGNSTAYVGGFAGRNTRYIYNAEAVVPITTVYNNGAKIYVGGFVGDNEGTITDAYAFTHIDSTISGTNANTVATGFAGENRNGRITYSYCGASLISNANHPSYGFCPAEGTATECYYLTGSAFNFAGRAWNYSLTGGRGVGVSSLNNVFGSDFDIESRNAFLTDFTMYTYSPVITVNGEDMHFGDWPVSADFGDYGAFYWELEEGGSNPGYHYSFVGFDVYNDGTRRPIRVTTLCKSHDDGGKITQYGYGYYINRKAGGHTSGYGQLQVDKGNTDFRENSSNTAVENRIKNTDFVDINEGFSNYEIKAYTTGTGTNNLKMVGNNATSIWILREKNGITFAKFEISPFFANAIVPLADNEGIGKLGTEDYPIEIRNVTQLQYLNWNATNKNNTTVVANSNNNTPNRSFPYLSFVENTGVITPAPGSGFNYIQTHDIDASTNSNFTPIGSLIDGTPLAAGSNARIVYFDGSFDGNDYTIKNLRINSTNHNVGLFGITIGAKLKNIVMYSDNNTEIICTATSNHWYNIGGLVGFAAAGNNGDASIDNCSVSGYNVRDRRGVYRVILEINVPNASDGKGGYGGGSVGGLVGATNMDITGCTAVNNVEAGFWYYYDSDGVSKVCAGGIAGRCRGVLRDCYAGGTIIGKVDAIFNGYREKSGCPILVGGLFGGIYMKNDGNLASLVGNVTRQAKAINCYSYAVVPKDELDKIHETQSLAYNGVVERAGDPALAGETVVIIENCYALSKSAEESDDYKTFANRTDWDGNVNVNVNSTEESRAILLNNNGRSPYLSYEEMSELDLPGFDRVTIREGGVNVQGKYSYNTDPSLDSFDYPFPTILTMHSSATSEIVNVHYGDWPKPGLYWEGSYTEMDIFSDPRNGEGYVQKNITLKSDLGGTLNNNSFTFTYFDENNEEIDEDSACAIISNVSWNNSAKRLTCTVTAIKPGITQIRANVGTNRTANYEIAVNANLDIICTPSDVSGYVGDIVSSSLVAVIPGTETPVEVSAWEATTGNGEVATVTTNGNTLNIECIGEGEAVLSAFCRYVYAGEEHTHGNSGQVNLTVEPVIGVVGKEGSVMRANATTTEANVTGEAPTAFAGFGEAEAPYIYLFASEANDDVNDVGLLSATVNDGNEDFTVGDGVYSIVLGEANGGIRPFTLSGPAGDVTLTMVLSFNETTYTFTVEVTIAEPMQIQNAPPAPPKPEEQEPPAPEDEQEEPPEPKPEQTNEPTEDQSETETSAQNDPTNTKQEQETVPAPEPAPIVVDPNTSEG